VSLRFRSFTEHFPGWADPSPSPNGVGSPFFLSCGHVSPPSDIERHFFPFSPAPRCSNVPFFPPQWPPHCFSNAWRRPFPLNSFWSNVIFSLLIIVFFSHTVDPFPERISWFTLLQTPVSKPGRRVVPPAGCRPAATSTPPFSLACIWFLPKHTHFLFLPQSALEILPPPRKLPFPYANTPPAGVKFKAQEDLPP